MFLFSKWLELPISTRHKIAAQFDIIKRGSTEVVGNTIKSDGYIIKEVEEALNIDALQKYIETTETDMAMLWIWLVEKIEGKLLTQVNIDTTLFSRGFGGDPSDDSLEIHDAIKLKEPRVNLGGFDDKGNPEPITGGKGSIWEAIKLRNSEPIKEVIKPKRGRPKKNK